MPLWLIITLSITGYVLMIPFWIGVFWRLWDCHPTQSGDQEFPVGFFCVFWGVTIPVYALWHLGHKIVDRYVK